jgi:hypothetical protein
VRRRRPGRGADGGRKRGGAGGVGTGFARNSGRGGSGRPRTPPIVHGAGVLLRGRPLRGPPLALAGKNMSAPSAKKSASEAATILRPPCRSPSCVPLRRLGTPTWRVPRRCSTESPAWRRHPAARLAMAEVSPLLRAALSSGSTSRVRSSRQGSDQASFLARWC